MSRPGAPFGEKHPRAKLTDAQVREIRALNIAGRGYRRLARDYSAGMATIRDICTYRTRFNA